MPDLKFRFKVDYFGSLSKHIVKKQYVNGEMLAEAQRARARAWRSRIRDREGACGRALRDRGRVARGRGCVLHAPRRDRGGDGRARSRKLRRQPAPCRARGADDPGCEARHRPRGARGRVGEAGGGSRVRREGAGGRGGVEDGRARNAGTGERARNDALAGARRRRRA